MDLNIPAEEFQLQSDSITEEKDKIFDGACNQGNGAFSCITTPDIQPD